MTTRHTKRKQSEPDDDDGRDYPDKRRKQQLSSAPSSKESAEERRERIAQEVEDGECSSGTNEPSSSSQGEGNTRRLHVRGVNITAENGMHLIRYLNLVMRRRNLCKDDDCPIMDTDEIDRCFLVFKSAEMATQALQLNGIDFRGSTLTIERPPDALAQSVEDVDDSCSSVALQELSTSTISKKAKKTARRLYVKGLVIKKDDRSGFVQFINQELRDRRLSAGNERPVVSIHDDLIVCASPETPSHTLSLTGTRYNDETFLVFKSAEMATQALQLNEIDFRGSLLTFERPHDDSCLSVALLEPSTSAISKKAKKTARRLYVKGMVIKKDDRLAFFQFINQELCDRRLSAGIERPVVSISYDFVVCASPETALHTLSLTGTRSNVETDRCFLVFKSAEMATQALQLNEIDFRGSLLTFERPHAYTGPPDLHVTQSAETMKDDSLEPSTAAISNNDDKRARGLYVKGMVIKKDDRAGFLQFLNQALRARRLSAGIERPVVSIHDDFVVCASPETALHALSLTGTRYNHHHLDLHRSNEMDCRLKVATRIKVRDAFKYLNEQMRTRKLCGASECPIVACLNHSLVFNCAEMANRAYTLNGIDYDGSIIMLERPSQFVRAPPTVDTPTTPSALSSYRQEGASCERLNELTCRLYVMGRMPRHNESKGKFLQFLNEAMQEQKLCGAIERPLLEEMQGTNRRFLDFPNPQQATRALALDGIEYEGCMLAFQRPIDYSGPPDHHRVDKVILQKQMARRLLVEGIQLEGGDGIAFIEFLNETMVRKGLCVQNECSVVDCKWMETLSVTRWLLFFRTPEKATCALDLSGVDYNESILSFARPDGYTAPANSGSMNMTDAAANLQDPALPGVPSKYGTINADSFNSQLADMEASLEEMKNSKQKELENNQRLVEEATTTQKIADFNRESLATVSKLWREATAQIKVQETKFISATGEIARLKLSLEKLERHEHGHALVNEELVHENDRHKQINAQLEKAAKTETTRSEELGSKLETANQRIQRMGEILANSMDELISERKNLRELKARMETSLQSEKAERENLETQVEDLKTAAQSRLPVPVSRVKQEQGNSKPAVKREQEWDV
jgi:hypothetical protein